MTGHKKNFLAIAVLIFVITIITISIYKRQRTDIKYTRTLMGTVVEITLSGRNETSLNTAAEAAFDEIKRLEGLMSHYTNDSDVARINKAAGRDAVAVSMETMEVIEASLEISEITNGAFDITMGILGNVWYFTTADNGRSERDGGMSPPSMERVKKLLPLIDYRKIIIDKKNNAVKLAKKGMRINLGGIAKGYITGRAAEVLRKNGIKKGIVHAGGDMLVFQEPGDNPWLIGVQDPRKKGKIVGTIEAVNAAIATSGDYERFFIKDGIRYHHIMDPSTGFPANKTMGVTIIAKNPMLADAVSTAVFVMGPDSGMELLEKLPDVDGLIIDADGNIKISSGLKKIYTNQRLN
ncbi:MAG: hypothetical protein A2W63_04830 [Deltaproteobacteria bacterium RIFCSPLOWO2_02_44_9]|nr:MAG: hypothetical protein A2W63_04830 [Deltaproteobacteria bacterium RIFCSPLOWO2_02_44_9]